MSADDDSAESSLALSESSGQKSTLGTSSSTNTVDVTNTIASAAAQTDQQLQSSSAPQEPQQQQRTDMDQLAKSISQTLQLSPRPVTTVGSANNTGESQQAASRLAVQLQQVRANAKDEDEIHKKSQATSPARSVSSSLSSDCVMVLFLYVCDNLCVVCVACTHFTISRSISISSSGFALSFVSYRSHESSQQHFQTSLFQ